LKQYKVYLTKAAKIDLYNTRQYIAEQMQMPITAFRLSKKIKRELKEKLSFTPQKFRLVSNVRLAAMGYRRMNVKNYIVLFIISEDDNTVNVARVINRLRDLDAVLRDM